MKNLKLFFSVSAIILSVIVCDMKAQAKNSNNVPEVVIASFNRKYPNAKVRRWNTKGDKFIAKAKINNSACSVAFDKNGNWMSTMSNIRWTWKLPNAVLQAWSNTQYREWHVDFATKIENPEGEFYRIIADDSNLQPDWDHQAVFTKYKALMFKADGALANVTDVTDGPIAYSESNR